MCYIFCANCKKFRSGYLTSLQEAYFKNNFFIFSAIVGRCLVEVFFSEWKVVLFILVIFSNSKKWKNSKNGKFSCLQIGAIILHFFNKLKLIITDPKYPNQNFVGDHFIDSVFDLTIILRMIFKWCQKKILHADDNFLILER